MDSKQLSQGLASLGRNGDSMLVHMNPNEVAGLQRIAMAQGGSLSINPDTGMPEAFSIGGVFEALAPVAAGFALGPGGFGLFNSALGAGLAVGGITAALTGDIGAGAMAGLGAYGGSSLGDIFAKTGAGGVTSAAGPEVIQQEIAAAAPANVSQAIGGGGANISMYTPKGAAFGAGQQLTSGLAGKMPATTGLGATNANLGGLNLSGTGSAAQPGIIGPTGQIGPSGYSKMPVSDVVYPNAPPAVQDLASSNTFDQLASNIDTTGFQKSGAGIKDLFSQGGYDRFKAAGGSAFDLASPVVTAGLGGLEPSDLGYTDTLYNDPDKGKWLGPAGQLNLNYSSGLRLAANGGLMKSYQTGGTITTGGLGALYGTDDNQDMAISKAPYGIGRLNNLASEQSMNQAKTYGYAEGGIAYLSGGGDGMSDDIKANIDGQQEARLSDGEFVIPADVVSHLGNGSSDAGAKRLYSMMDKVRMARTGNKEQGKQISAERYMPA